MLRFRFKNFRYKLGILSLLVCGAVSYSTPSRASVYDPAYANVAYNCSSGTGCCMPSMLPSLIHEMFTGTGLYTGQQDLQNYYYMKTLWPKIEEALKQVSDDLRNTVLLSIGAKGALIDGQVFEQTLRSLEKQEAESVNRYAVNDSLCRFGTLSRSLAQSQDKSRAAQLTLAKAMVDRQTLKKNMSSENSEGKGRMIGRTADKLSRFGAYKDMFCDPSDSGAAIGTGWCSNSNDPGFNRDIDATRTLFAPLTIDADFTGSATTAATQAEKNVFSLASNLYGHNLPLNISPADFRGMVNGGSSVADSQSEKLFDVRSIVAKRSVAQNSFAALAAMKAAGSGGSTAYMKEVLNHLGLSAAKDLTAEIGDNPSYYAQMDMLTRKIYQSPAFYANLMESPTNVAREQASIEGITLMQDRDIYESLRRSEMLLSTLLEVYVMHEQDALKDRGVK